MLDKNHESVVALINAGVDCFAEMQMEGYHPDLIDHLYPQSSENLYLQSPVGVALKQHNSELVRRMFETELAQRPTTTPQRMKARATAWTRALQLFGIEFADEFFAIVQNLHQVSVSSTPVGELISSRNQIVPPILKEQLKTLLQYMLSKDPSCINVRSEQGETPLVTAISRVQDDIIELLLEGGADINEVDSKGRTVFALVAEVSVLVKLLPHIPATEAAYRDLLFVIPKMVLRSPHVNEQLEKIFSVSPWPLEYTNEKGETALFLAVAHYNVEALQLFLQLGMNVNHQAANGGTVLMQAVAKVASMVPLLLAAKADVNLEDDNGDTAVMLCQDVGTVRSLLAAGAKLSSLLADGSSLLVRSFTARERSNLPLLLQLGLNVNIRDAEGQTPLTVACARGHTAEVRMLLAAGADPNWPNAQSELPLSLALKASNNLAAEALLKAGASPVPTVSNGESAYTFAARHNDRWVMEELLKLNHPVANKVIDFDALLRLATNPTIILSIRAYMKRNKIESADQRHRQTATYMEKRFIAGLQYVQKSLAHFRKELEELAAYWGYQDGGGLEDLDTIVRKASSEMPTLTELRASGLEVQHFLAPFIESLSNDATALEASVGELLSQFGGFFQSTLVAREDIQTSAGVLRVQLDRFLERLIPLPPSIAEKIRHVSVHLSLNAMLIDVSNNDGLTKAAVTRLAGASFSLASKAFKIRDAFNQSPTLHRLLANTVGTSFSRNSVLQPALEWAMSVSRVSSSPYFSIVLGASKGEFTSVLDATWIGRDHYVCSGSAKFVSFFFEKIVVADQGTVEAGIRDRVSAMVNALTTMEDDSGEDKRRDVEHIMERSSEEERKKLDAVLDAIDSKEKVHMPKITASIADFLRLSSEGFHSLYVSYQLRLDQLLERVRKGASVAPSAVEAMVTEALDPLIQDAANLGSQLGEHEPDSVKSSAVEALVQDLKNNAFLDDIMLERQLGAYVEVWRTFASEGSPIQLTNFAEVIGRWAASCELNELVFRAKDRSVRMLKNVEGLLKPLPKSDERRDVDALLLDSLQQVQLLIVDNIKIIDKVVDAKRTLTRVFHQHSNTIRSYRTHRNHLRAVARAYEQMRNELATERLSEAWHTYKCLRTDFWKTFEQAYPDIDAFAVDLDDASLYDMEDELKRKQELKRRKAILSTNLDSILETVPAVLDDERWMATQDGLNRLQLARRLYGSILKVGAFDVLPRFFKAVGKIIAREPFAPPEYGLKQYSLVFRKRPGELKRLEIRWSSKLEDALAQLTTPRQEHFGGTLLVFYLNDAGVRQNGIDAGGLSKDLLSSLITELTDKSRGLLDCSQGSAECAFNNDDLTERKRDEVRLLAYVVALVLRHENAAAINLPLRYYQRIAQLLHYDYSQMPPTFDVLFRESSSAVESLESTMALFSTDNPQQTRDEGLWGLSASAMLDLLDPSFPSKETVRSWKTMLDWREWAVEQMIGKSWKDIPAEQKSDVLGEIFAHEFVAAWNDNEKGRLSRLSGSGWKTLVEGESKFELADLLQRVQWPADLTAVEALNKQAVTNVLTKWWTEAPQHIEQLIFFVTGEKRMSSQTTISFKPAPGYDVTERKTSKARLPVGHACFSIMDWFTISANDLQGDTQRQLEAIQTTAQDKLQTAIYNTAFELS
eukprot:GILK01012385.1.p1 GENE.GILK01012385.1~~GILK01012385.1.p1  ORF type:complete len:1648 (-),score=284.26 GILK01012385.1:18-4961(-)